MWKKRGRSGIELKMWK